MGKSMSNITKVQEVFNHRANEWCFNRSKWDEKLEQNFAVNEKFIYLISPNQVTKNFYKKLDSVLSSNKIKFFQLRLKKYSFEEILKLEKIKVITDKYNVKLIINDSPHLAKKINADGCHLGQSDMSIEKAKKILKSNKIIGLTCHGSKN